MKKSEQVQFRESGNDPQYAYESFTIALQAIMDSRCVDLDEAFRLTIEDCQRSCSTEIIPFVNSAYRWLKQTE